MRDLPGFADIVALAVVFSLGADVVHADRFTLADIREHCAAPEGSEEFAFCRGYVVALIDGVIMRRDPDCIPPMVNDYQFALIMRKYLNANTDNLQLPAVEGVLRVIAETFRCTIKQAR